MTIDSSGKVHRPSGTPGGGQFTGVVNTPPRHGLSGSNPTTLTRATAGQVQVVYDRDPATDRLRVTTLLRDDALGEANGADAWVEEGSVLTDTPAGSDLERMTAVCVNQAERIASAIERGDDQHETIDAFLASLADRRDPFITRGTRRRHGEELKPVSPALNV
ncbi:hypothetical protein [Microbacterium gorillae]|uniref:hypothetical protein n=1 Tax=Microbacterium gorillae TaxID=1231063 RepID=UPI003D99E7D2